MQRDSHCSLFLFVMKMSTCNPVKWMINEVQSSICVNDEEIQQLLDRAVSDNDPTLI